MNFAYLPHVDLLTNKITIEISIISKKKKKLRKPIAIKSIMFLHISMSVCVCVFGIQLNKWVQRCYRDIKNK